VSSSPPLNLDAIRSTLATQALGGRIELRNRIGSTNREATVLAQAGCEHGTVVVADAQTEGRGRLSRSWFSPPGVNLYCSVVVRRPVRPDQLSLWLSWLPLMTAVAAAESVETVASTPVVVKWPNDLLVGERKLGGILCESGSGTNGQSFQVIGVGLNVNGRRNDFPVELRDGVTTIKDESGKSIDRNRLLAQFLHELEVCLEQFFTGGTEAMTLAYRRRCSTLGKTVKATLTSGQEFLGMAESIGPDGSLTVVQPSGKDDRPSTVHQLRVADIVHLRTRDIGDPVQNPVQ